jgi:exosortase H (IPTLxxWG-CTERM-specific)
MDRLRAAWVWISEPSHRFVPLFLGILWALTTLTRKIPKTAIQSFLETTALIDYFLLDAFLDGVSQRGTTLTHDGFSVQVVTECTGLFEAVILVSAVLAYKARWSERGIGIVLGVFVLYFLNIIRIGFLLLVGRYAPRFFDFAHIYFWQSLLIVFITGIWLGWIHYFVRDEKDTPLHA